ncbi:MAG: autotransporter-associated beta strand repeat-containing protein, partial [Actinomycetota bacterium]
MSGASGTSTTFAGVISGSGGALTKAGDSTLTLSGNNTYTGATLVSDGTLVVANNNALGSTGGTTTVSNGAQLQLSGSITSPEPISANGLALNQGVIHNASGSNTLS